MEHKVDGTTSAIVIVVSLCREIRPMEYKSPVRRENIPRIRQCLVSLKNGPTRYLIGPPREAVEPFNHSDDE